MRLLLVCALLAARLLPVALAQRCNLIYCTRFGHRAECVFQSDFFPCALWHSLETRVNPTLCDSDCPRQCEPADRRPIASNGKVYCTQCALQYASCESRFTVYGPVNFGVPTDLPVASLGVGVTPPPTPSPSSLPLAQPNGPMSVPALVSLQPQVNMSVGPLEIPMPAPTAMQLSVDILPASPIDDFLMDQSDITQPQVTQAAQTESDMAESPMPSSWEDYPAPTFEQVPLSCQRELNIFERVQCCTQFDIGCLQSGQNCSTSGSLFPPLPCAKGLQCIIFDPGFPAADRPNRGNCRALDTPVESPDSEQPEQSPLAAPAPSPQLPLGAFCSTQGGLFPTPLCQSGLFCDIFDPGFPPADVANRGVCRPEGSTPLTAPDQSPSPVVPLECQGDVGALALRTCCLQNGVRCLRRGQLCSTAGSRIPPVPCASGLSCRIFDQGFPPADIPNRGVCLES